jgi:tetratricopeptide (TPR) repeat protein/predicted Ser/Thr protein kinase
VRCSKCGTVLDLGDLTSETGTPSGWSVRTPASGGGTGPAVEVSFPPGSVVAGRYEILQMIGEGGMGAVYKAKDRELDRLICLKVIRSELASRPEVLQRFKQELILARKVTHKNVVRTYDLGEFEGTRFITMEFIEGRDLKSLVQERGKIPPGEAVAILQQICRGLAAAHNEGVVHRDLKPQNVMLEANGRASIMDFGIARSIEQSGLTTAGVMIGTPDYMSPEQAMGQTADSRSDLFSAGLIFYEMLTGKLPYQADTSLGKIMKRTKERPPPPKSIDDSVPKLLSDICLRCLEIAPEKRFQKAEEILQALDATGQRSRSGTTTVIALPGLGTRPLTWKHFAVAGTVLVALIVALVFIQRKYFSPPPAAHPPLTVLLADFDNKTNDAVFDGTLEPMLSIALEGAPFISSYSRGQAHKIGAKLREGATRLDEGLARLVAVREGVSVVVAGEVSPEGGGYRLAIRAVDAATGNSLASRAMSASSKEEVLPTLSKLSARIRSALGDTTPQSAQSAAAETFTAASLEAAHSYAEAQEFQWEGKWDDAVRSYTHAVQLDPSFGRAYAGLAAMQENLGHHAEALKDYELALAQIDRMTPRERYRTRSGYYLATRNQEKAIEELSELVKQFPGDSAGVANLALAYFYKRDMSKALEEGRRAVENNPKNVLQRNNLALYAMYAGDFETAIREAQALLQLNPNFAKGYCTLALAQFAQGQTAQSTEAYNRLLGLSAWGASQAATGNADIALYQGRFSSAAETLEKGIAGDLANKETEGAANKLATLATTLLAMGRKGPALAAADRALAQSRSESVLYVVALVYLGGGAEAKAHALVAELGKMTERDPQAYAKLLEGEILLARGKAADALAAFEEARKIADTWLGRFALGRAYLEAGKFTEAYAEFETCQKRRGEATAVFLDDLPTYRIFPPVLYYFGRAQEGLKSAGAADSFKTFLGIKEKSEADPLVADARRRLAGM